MKRIYIVLFSLLFISIIGIVVLNTVLYTSNVKVEDNKRVFIDIPKKASFEDVVKRLSPYIKSQQTFRWASKIKRFSKAKAGRYLLKSGINNNELINMLRIGKQVEINLTFNNQNTLEDLAGAVSRQISADSVSLLKAMKDKAFLSKNGFTEATALLMYVPNTYRFYYNTNAEQFRSKMLKSYNKFWNEKRNKLAKKQNLSPIEVGILASIVQKESTKKEELPRIAGVYLNRLKKHMLLQADPTVVYAYRQKYGKDLVIKRVLNKHKAVNSPYNTYKNGGLPPGPICMPDIQSINAVLNPEKHNYYYFVADFDKPGYHIFNERLSQHNRDANKYHKGLNKAKIFH